MQANFTNKESNKSSKATKFVEEILGNIRLIKSFNAEEHEAQRYTELLIPAQKLSAKKGLLSGIGEAVVQVLYISSRAIAYWYGVQLLFDSKETELKEFNSAALLIVFVVSYLFYTLN